MRKRKISVFDLFGILWVLIFTFVMVGHLKDGESTGEEVAIALTPEDLDSGFREGVEWHGIYLREAKVGFSKLERRIVPEGYQLKHLMRLNMTVMRQNQTLTTTVNTILNKDYTLKEFEMKMDNPAAPFMAKGKVEGTRVAVEMLMGDYEEKRSITLKKPPIVELGVRPLLFRKDLKKNERYTMKYFDPMSLNEKEMIVVYLGKSKMQSLGEEIEAHQLRRFIGNQAFDAWVNELGEVLDERLPLGYVSIRESQAEATYGVMRYQGTVQQDVVEQSAVRPQKEEGQYANAQSAIWHFSGFSTDSFDVHGGRQLMRKADGHYELKIQRNHPASELNTEEQKKYLAEEMMLQVAAPEVQSALADALNAKRDGQSKADAVVNWVFKKLKKKPVVSVPNAVQILKSKEGDCNEHATLTVTMLRAAGVPSRIASGLAYLDGRFLFHAWVEYHDGERWISADPTWGQGNADVGHVRFLVGGLERQLALIQIVGNLRLQHLKWE